MRTILAFSAAIAGCFLFGLAATADAQTTGERKILFVLSAHEHGYWLPEVLTPYQLLTDAGLQVDFATPGGESGVQAGADMMNDVERRTLAAIEDTLARPRSLASIDPDDYHAMYVPGGAGPMFDLYDHPEVNRITAVMYEAGKPVAADCHGPAAFAAVRLSTGALMVAGKRMTAKSNAEEGDWARANYPFLLEDKLNEVSAEFSATEPYEAWVVRDGNLLTGQNPASAGPLADAILEALAARDRTLSSTSKP